MHSILRLAAVAAAVLPSSLAFAQSATYDVHFEATWSASSHPGAYPAAAHFSPLIGGTHNAGVSFWGPGAIASQGIETMAETGGTFPLFSEVNAAITAGTAGEVITGSGIVSPGMTTSTFTVTPSHSLVTIVTMIAPSPDWFVGVHGLDLMENGAFVKQKVVSLFAYDSGTDSGGNFNSQNNDTNPQEPIALITGGPFFGSTPLGTFTFTLQGAAPSSYCQGKLNSDGCFPVIGFNGVPSVTDANPFNITADGAVALKNGLMFYGYAAAAIPFNGGTLCVQPPLRRTGIQNSGGQNGVPCDGSFSFDMNAQIQSGIDPGLTIGSEAFTQYWFRDPADANGVGLSNAARFLVCP